MAYRQLLDDFVKVSFVDFVNYYMDAKSIDFSHNQALDYAYKCCLQKQNESSNNESGK